jgi:hypothetical protein
MMSYCRWSCDDFRSDVYCYAHVDGTWTTHVAGNKVVGEVPHVPCILDVPPEEFAAAHKTQMEFLDKAERRPIGLAHDGETFKDAGRQEMIDRLLYLRSIGYHVPEHALERLRDEICRSPSSS